MPESGSGPGPGPGAWPILEVNIRHRIGGLAIEAAFALRQPWTVLFGPSGAGKSMLLRVLAGLIRPDAGSVRLGDRTLMDAEARVFVPSGRRGIGFLTQDEALFPHLDVHANVGFGLRALPKAERNARIDSVLSLFHADALSRRMPASLSGGERQRVSLARVLAAEPKLLLLDEPFAALDALLKKSIFDDLLPWLEAREIPVLYVSHDLAEALETGSEVIALSEGRITAQGPASVVLAAERRSLLLRLGVPG